MLNGFPHHLQRDPKRFDPHRAASNVSKMLDTVDSRPIAPGGSEMDESGLISICPRTCKTSNGKRNVSMRLLDSPLRHGDSDLTAHRSTGVDPLPPNAQQLALRFLAIDGEAALERMARSLYIGEQRGEQTARATFRRCKAQSRFTCRLQHGGGGVFHVVGQYGG